MAWLPAALVAVPVLLTGCSSIDDLNPFQRDPEPLPPVQGNVIATSSSSTLRERLGTETQPGITDPAAPITGPDATTAGP